MTSGVLIFKGMRVGVLPGDFVIDLDPAGNNTNAQIILSTSYNVIPIWLRAARTHLQGAKEASAQIASCWHQDGVDKRNLLVSELEPAMQTIVCCAIALDALYDQVNRHVSISPTTRAAWAKNRTSRSARVLHAVKLAFRLSNGATKQIAPVLSEVFRYRDMAVHPASELKRTCSRPDLPEGVDWRFAAYRFPNAKSCFDFTLELMRHLVNRRCRIPQLSEEMGRVNEALEELGVIGSP